MRADRYSKKVDLEAPLPLSPGFAGDLELTLEVAESIFLALLGLCLVLTHSISRPATWNPS